MANFACQNLGLFEECKDIGPTLYQNSRINTCRNLGYFLRTRFLTPNTHCLYGLSKSCFFFFLRERRYWAYIVSKFQVKHPSKSWLFNKNHVSWRQKHIIKILGFLTRTEILGLYCIKISSKTAVKILGYFIRTMFFDAKKKKKKKKHGLFCLSKSWDF